MYIHCTCIYMYNICSTVHSASCSVLCMQYVDVHYTCTCIYMYIYMYMYMGTCTHALYMYTYALYMYKYTCKSQFLMYVHVHVHVLIEHVQCTCSFTLTCTCAYSVVYIHLHVPRMHGPSMFIVSCVVLQQETLKSVQEERERLGVKLYGIQQQLARQQTLLEKEQDEVNTHRTLREQRDVTLGQVREMYRKMQSQLKTERQQSKRRQHHLFTVLLLIHPRVQSTMYMYMYCM